MTMTSLAADPTDTPVANPAANLPLFMQIASRLRQDIIDKRLSPGAKLPSEAKLETDFGVSRITVRQALSELHSQGLIRKINGKGSFVTQPGDGPRLGPLTGFYDHIRMQGQVASGTTLAVRQVKASTAAAEALKLEPGTTLTRMTVLRFANDRPMAWGQLYAEPEMAQALMAENLDSNDVMSVLESRLGYRLKSTHIEATAVTAGKQRGEVLGIDPGAPLLLISFTPHDVTDRALAYCEMYFRADRFSYQAIVNR